MPQSARLRFGHGLIAVVLCLGLMVVSPARAETQTPDPDPGSAATDLPIWQRTLYKTLTYQAVANLSDVALYNLLIGGSAATAGSFFAANALSAAALYYGFEYTWQSLRPPLEETDAAVLAEKTVLYRVINPEFRSGVHVQRHFDGGRRVRRRELRHRYRYFRGE
jgi:hypothetical protein